MPRTARSFKPRYPAWLMSPIEDPDNGPTFRPAQAGQPSGSVSELGYDWG